MSASVPPVTRVLVVDDNRAIHADFAKILGHVENAAATALAVLEDTLFGRAASPSAPGPAFALSSAYQGLDAVHLVASARQAGTPFALAFVDMRMPPGCDGLDTIAAIWELDPEIQVVICSAYSDRSWGEVRERLGDRDSLLILKKPFDPIEVLQTTHAMTAKWRLGAAARAHVEQLETAVRLRTAELEATASRLSVELAHRDRMEAQLRMAHKLEAIGQVAAGVAHEIATPLQYVGDNVTFAREAYEAAQRAWSAMRVAVDRAGDPLLVSEVDVIAEAEELTYFTKQAPAAFASAQEGVGRIVKIVRAMRELSHPGERVAAPADLNRVLANALEISASSYRRLAELATTFAPLPPVTCFASDLTQVFLNLIINAAQAIEDRGGTGGRLGVTTTVDGAHVVIAISDNGGGIPAHIQDRVFDAFFTTKEVGRGTGQGLAIARSIIVERHGGHLTFESVDGQGTVFVIRLPIAGPRSRPARSSAPPTSLRL